MKIDVLITTGTEHSIFVDSNHTEIVRVLSQNLQLRHISLLQTSLALLHLPDLDKLAAGAHTHHVPVVRDPDTVHVLIMILVTPPEPASPNLCKRFYGEIIFFSETRNKDFCKCETKN